MFQNTVNNRRIVIDSFGDLKKLAHKMPKEYWKNRVLAQGYRMLIAGAPKVGKSDFFIEMVLKASCGGKFLGENFSTPLKVLYLQAEIHEAYLEERISVFEKSVYFEQKSLADENIYISSRLNLDLMNNRDWNDLKNIAIGVQPDIIGIDPIISFSSVDENSSKEVSELLYDRVVGLQNSVDSNPAMVLIHHLKKTRDESDMSLFSNIRGSGAWQGWYDTGILLSRSNERVDVHYDTRHQKSPESQHIYLNRDIGCWQEVQKSNKRSEKVEKAISIIRESNILLSSSQLRDNLEHSLGVSRRSAYNLIETLKTHPDVKINRTNRQKILFEVV